MDTVTVGVAVVAVIAVGILSAGSVVNFLKQRNSKSLLANLTTSEGADDESKYRTMKIWRMYILDLLENQFRLNNGEYEVHFEYPSALLVKITAQALHRVNDQKLNDEFTWVGSISHLTVKLEVVNNPSTTI